jgi:hypothetical protein
MTIQANYDTPRFSDSRMLYMPLEDAADHPLVVRGIMTILVSCSGLIVAQLAKGAKDYRETLPLRGGMSVDVGAEVADRGAKPDATPVFYSEGLAESYKLESQDAKYPRVLVSDKSNDLIRSFCEILPRWRRRPLSWPEAASATWKRSRRSVFPQPGRFCAAYTSVIVVSRR